MVRRGRCLHDANGLIEGMRPATAFFDMATNSVATVRKIHAAFAEKNLYMLDSPVSGGPSGAADYAALIRLQGCFPTGLFIGRRPSSAHAPAGNCGPG